MSRTTQVPPPTSPLEGEVDQRRLAGADREGGRVFDDPSRGIYPPPQPSPARWEGARRASSCGSAQATKDAALLARAWAAASQVVDPEIPVLTIADLGILRDIKVEQGRIEVIITPTYSGCPAMALIALNLDMALEDAGLGLARITTVLSPAWTTDWMTEEGKEKLRQYGVAPPTGPAGKRALFGEVLVSCPRCGATDTERISEFGSTSCKALWRCRACAEPFDYFKCI